jgi:hypothetical protein
MRTRMARSFQVRIPHIYYMLCLQLMYLATMSPVVQRGRSGNPSNSEGVPPAGVGIALAGAASEVATAAGTIVPMDEDEDGGETPRKSQLGKRAIVLSPTSNKDVPQAQRQRRSSSARVPVRVLHLFNRSGLTNYPFQEFCGPCWKTGLLECVAQTGKKASATACTSCAQRKINCNPPADWALEREAQKAQGKAPKPKTARRQSIASALIVPSIYCANHLPAAKEDTPLNLEAVWATVQRDNAEFRDRLHNIETLLRELAKKEGINVSALNLRLLPPVPPFDAPSPVISTTSAVSTASTSTSINISKLSLASPSIAGPSGSGAGKSKAQGECSDTSDILGMRC